MATVLEEIDEQTTVDFEKLPEYYEVVNGNIMELPPMSNYAGQVALRVHNAMNRYFISNDIGVSGTEILHRIPLSEDRSRNRRPDHSFVSYERWAKTRPIPFTGNAWDVVPDIATEVVSPGDLADELIAKAREYLRGGVRLVWIVYPLAQEVHAYVPASRNVRVYFASDELDAGDILPGFSTSVGALFPPTEPPAAATQADA